MLVGLPGCMQNFGMDLKKWNSWEFFFNLPKDTTSFPSSISSIVAFYQGADFTLKADTPDLQAALEASIGEKFDMSFECCGVPAALNSCIEVTIPGGVVCVVANMPKTVHVDLQVACRHEVHELLMRLFFIIKKVMIFDIIFQDFLLRTYCQGSKLVPF